MLFNVTCVLQGPGGTISVPAANNPFEAKSLPALLRVLDVPDNNGIETIGLTIELVGSEAPAVFWEDEAPKEFHQSPSNVVMYRGYEYHFIDRKWWRQ